MVQGEKTPWSLDNILLLEAPLTDAQRVALSIIVEEGEPELRAAAALILYREDTTNAWPWLLDTFAIRDYAKRAAGEYTFLTSEEMGSKIDEIDAAHPPSVSGNSPTMLRAFLHYQDLNLWVETVRNPRISVARFCRGALFGMVLGKEIGLEAANRIDLEIRNAMMGG